MKIDKEFALKMGWKAKDINRINIFLTSSQNKGSKTTTIVTPKKGTIKPFVIINN